MAKDSRDSGAGGVIPSNNERDARHRAADEVRRRAAVEGANHPKVEHMPGGCPGSISTPRNK